MTAGNESFIYKIAPNIEPVNMNNFTMIRANCFSFNRMRRNNSRISKATCTSYKYDYRYNSSSSNYLDFSFANFHYQNFHSQLFC